MTKIIGVVIFLNIFTRRIIVSLGYTGENYE